MDIKEKNMPLCEPTDADYIMFNHDVLRACWDLMILKKLENFSEDCKITDNDSETTTKAIDTIKAIPQIETSVERLDFSNESNAVEYRYNSICEGTQLLNSFEGMLILPFQKNLSERLKKKEYSFEDYDLPTLRSFLGEGNYINSYFNLKQNSKTYGKEKNLDPMVIIKHLRNSMTHDRLGLMPINTGMEIKKIKFIDEYKWKFTDENGNVCDENQIANKNEIEKEKYEKYIKTRSPKEWYANEFKLTIDFDKTDTVLEEISKFINEVSQNET